MTPPTPPSPHDEVYVEPDPTGTPGQQASELVIDGLLRSLAARDPERTTRRVARVVRALHAGGARTPHAMPAPPRLARRRWWRAAAVALLAVGAFFALSRLGVPGERSALAEVLDAITAMRLPGDRRYEIRVVTKTGAEVNPVPDTIDARYPEGFMLVRHHPPFADGDVFVGRDEQGLWALAPGGTTNRESPRRSLPPWSSLDNTWILEDTVDRFLESLTRSYTLSPAVADPLPGSGTPAHRITATRKTSGSPRSPSTVVLWLDPASRVLERLELKWDPAIADVPGGSGGRGRPGPPRMVSFQRVPAAPFPADWFRPEGHPAR